jgi:hypothetical protein
MYINSQVQNKRGINKMKKRYTTSKYKGWQKKKQKKEVRRKRKRNRYDPNRHPYANKVRYLVEIKDAIQVPNDFRMIENTEECLDFFMKLRDPMNLSKVRNKKFVELAFQDVSQIDYSSISILTAIIDDFDYKDIVLRTNFPKNDSVRQYIVESGFLDNMYDSKGKPFPKSDVSDTLLFEKGTNKLHRRENIGVTQSLKKIKKHLTGDDAHCPSIRTILLEICGNSIEWANTDNKQWLFGVKYEEDRVVVTFTDVGKGILATLYKKMEQKIIDTVSFKSDVKVLEHAFQKKYSSKSRKLNRNKGLPEIRKRFEEGKIQELKVITNNVILHFDNTGKSKQFNNTSFDGTFYRWVVTKDCLS